jgi:hypothetical protein
VNADGQLTSEKTMNPNLAESRLALPVRSQSAIFVENAGAHEYIERPTAADDILEGFGRLTNPHQRVEKKRVPRGSVSTLPIDEPRRIAIPDEPPGRSAKRRDFGPLIGLTLVVLAWLVWVPPLFVLVLVTSLAVFVLYRLICAGSRSSLEPRK